MSKNIGTRREAAGIKPIWTATQRALAPTDPEVERGILRGFGELKRAFSNELHSGLRRFNAGELTADELEAGWRVAIREHWNDAFRLGNEAEGWTGGLQREDVAWLKGATREEFGFLRGFVQDLAAGQVRMDPEERLNMYADTLDGLFEAGRVDALPENVAIYWYLGPVRTDHCGDCLELTDGGPYTKPGIEPNPLPTVPRMGDTVCLSRCACYLVVEEVPPDRLPTRERAAAPAQQERVQRPPAGFREPDDAERAYVDNLISQIAANRMATANLARDAAMEQIAARQHMTNELANFLADNRIWVRPTWAAGLRPADLAHMTGGDLERLLQGRDLRGDVLAQFINMPADEVRGWINRVQINIIGKAGVTLETARTRPAFQELRDAHACTRAGFSAVVIGRRDVE